ncbi:hypothetical protein FNF31_01957 [Cafeteria roenbergensis]|nr:hypothetical protein FNF31_01957 [Cafeteria roenbergensis]
MRVTDAAAARLLATGRAAGSAVWDLRRFSSSQVSGGSGSARSQWPGAVRLSPVERVALTVGSALTALGDPERGDMVAMLGETTGESALRAMASRMRADPDGKVLLEERPRIRDGDVASWNLASLPEASLGRAYGDFMASHGFDADSRAEVRYVTDDELAYVLQRYREAHDFLHPLTGLPPTVLGELGLKWLEMIQTGLPMTAMAALVGPLRLDAAERAVLTRHLVPWAAEQGRAARFLMAARFEAMLAWPLHQVRMDFGIAPAPDVDALLRHYRSVGWGGRTGLAHLAPWKRAGALSREDEASVAPAVWGSWRRPAHAPAR